MDNIIGIAALRSETFILAEENGADFPKKSFIQVQAIQLRLSRDLQVSVAGRGCSRDFLLKMLDRVRGGVKLQQE
jgi:hypothetical protein